jgi:hypothetical protein
MDEVIRHALVRQPQAIEWKEDLSPAKAPAAAEEDMSGIVAH